jgi:hypothetical protein
MSSCRTGRAGDAFGMYLDNNWGFIVNNGDRQRCGERISTGFLESTVHRQVAKCFVKTADALDALWRRPAAPGENPGAE